jgi:predicted nucleotidyltransferase
MKVLEPILEELKQDKNTLSIVVIGSFSRGEEDSFSDVDTQVIVKEDRPRDRIFYLENRLININFLSKENRESALHDPWMAICNLSAIREAKILFDPEGWYTDLQQRARSFNWKDVKQAADLSVSWIMAENAEIVQKILGGLQNGNPEKILRATVDLVSGLTDASALANGVLANSENRFWSSVRDSHADSTWKILFWKALGFSEESIITRANAALDLYDKTTTLYFDRLLENHKFIAQKACEFIKTRKSKR